MFLTKDFTPRRKLSARLRVEHQPVPSISVRLPATHRRGDGPGWDQMGTQEADSVAAAIGPEREGGRAHWGW